MISLTAAGQTKPLLGAWYSGVRPGAFRATDLATAEGKMSPKLSGLVADLEAARKERIAGVTIADLIPPEEGRKPG